MDDYELDKHFSELKASAKAVCTYIRWIKDSDDPEDISVFINAIEEVRMNGPVKLSLPTKEAIKIGQGDFAKIQKKCIELNLV
jgi:hypothetical protein